VKLDQYWWSLVVGCVLAHSAARTAAQAPVAGQSLQAPAPRPTEQQPTAAGAASAPAADNGAVEPSPQPEAAAVSTPPPIAAGEPDFQPQVVDGSQPPPPVKRGPTLLRGGFALREFSLGGAVSIATRGGSDNVGAALLSTRGVGDLDVGLVSVRYRDGGSIGVGPSGLEGGIGVDLAVGIHPWLWQHQGPVARLGLRADVFANDAIYNSWLELPQLQLGYQWLATDFQLELAARGGLLVVGRTELDGLRRKLDGELEVGGYAVARFRFLRADAEWAWVNVEPSWSAVQRGTVRLCVANQPWSACLFTNAYVAETAAGNARTRQIWMHAGLSVSFIQELLR
jgi:hypothetical protein